MKTFAFIFARGGSKGLPGKNVKLLKSKPLIRYPIELAQKIKSIDRIFISTDSEEIKQHAISDNVEIINRPQYLADDTSPEILAWKHAIEHVKNTYGDFQRFISLPCTSPLKTVEDVEACINALDEKIDLVTTICHSNSNPYFNLVVKDANDELGRIVETKFNRRQDAPEMFTITGLAYVTRPSFILNTDNIYSGKTKGILIPKKRSIDIDTDFDFKLIEFLMDEGSK